MQQDILGQILTSSFWVGLGVLTLGTILGASSRGIPKRKNINRAGIIGIILGAVMVIVPVGIFAFVWYSR